MSKRTICNTEPNQGCPDRPNKEELTHVEDKSRFIRLAMKLLELKDITDTDEIRSRLRSLAKQPRDTTSGES